MGTDSFSLMAECEDCHMKFNVSGENVVSKRELVVNGRSIYLTYYDCPSCGRRHFVQIDDEKSMSFLDVNLKQFMHNASIKTRGKKPKKKSIDKYKTTQKRLSDYRAELMKQYDGTTLYDEERSTEFVLRFSV